MRAILIVFTLLIAFGANAGPNYVVGQITNITAVNEGILVRVGVNAKADNCSDKNLWMLIPEAKNL